MFTQLFKFRKVSKKKEQAVDKLQGLSLWFAKLQVNSKVRMRIYEKLGRFVGNGVPIVQALSEIYIHLSYDGKRKNNPAAQAVNHWRLQVLNGKTFSYALDGWGSKSEISLLAAGELSGSFDRAVQDVIFLYEAKRKVNAALAGLIYPLFLLMSTCLYLYIFGNQVIPAFDSILPQEEWVGTGATMAMLSDFVQNKMLSVAFLIFLVMIVIIGTLSIWTGRVRQYFDLVPPWSFYRLVIGSNFLISLAALLHAGISVPDALLALSRQVSPWYRERLLAARMQILNGARNIGDALFRSGYQFPSREIVIDIRSYAQLEGFESMLDRLARQWLDETLVLLNRQMDLLRNLAILAMGFVFMWIAAGMFDLQQQISAAANR
ncbi:type II secretion system F family protein [Aeromonas sp. MdU4]|uniref:type II secretion system F family protein n=1 Tax=Aeromonas sp. MdU4 TaxID=3342819 RepID=UPI0035B790DB